MPITIITNKPRTIEMGGCSIVNCTAHIAKKEKMIR
jgi:hypothetical protein